MEVELGFVEKVESPSQLTSDFFPSKVGGKPAWLDPQNLPSPEVLSCGRCRVPLTFLLQVYAPLSDGDMGSAFHRSIFIFMCRDPSCHQQSGSQCFKVLRCQLPLVNDFYSQCFDEDEEPAAMSMQRLKLDGDGPLRTACERVACHGPSAQSAATSSDDAALAVGTGDTVKSKHSEVANPSSLNPPHSPPLCVVCGIAGPKKCAKCKNVSYCSKEHQTHDWRSGHKLFCSDFASGKHCVVDYNPSSGVTLPLFEIVTEPEPDLSSLESQPERSVEERMADYRRLVSTRNVDTSEMKGAGKTARQDCTKEKKKSDKQFKTFKKRVSLEPEQVIRYQRDSSPLLVSSEGVPTGREIPACTCGAKRVFELQVMPQLLYYLKLDDVRGPSIDWGTLLVYTCSNSCSSGPAYKEEFLWRQHFSP